MNSLAALLALSASFIPCSSRELNEDHHYVAVEWDVESPQDSPCATERGFFGRNAKYDARFSFEYELTLLGGEYLQDALVDMQNNGMAGRNGQPPVGLRGVFSAIETRIADALLASDIFDSVCAGGIARGPYRSDGGRQLRRNTHREMRAVGISSAPEDMILEGLSCSASANKTDGPCMVVDGEFVVYLDIYEDLDNDLADILINLMNERHHLDDAHPYIQTVRYISLTADGVVGSVEEEGGSGQPGGNSATLSSSFYALLAAGTFIIVGTAIFYRRRRNATEHDGETTTLDQSTAQLPQSQ